MLLAPMFVDVVTCHVLASSLWWQTDGNWALVLAFQYATRKLLAPIFINLVTWHVLAAMLWFLTTSSWTRLLLAYFVVWVLSAEFLTTAALGAAQA